MNDNSIYTKSNFFFKQIFLVVALLFITSASDKYANFPSQEIIIYVPFTAGGTTDILTRLIAKQMAADLNLPVTVETNDGRLSATDYVNDKKSISGDGYHLIIGNLGTHTSGTIINQDTVLYDPIDDFEPIALLGKSPMYMVVRPDFPADTFAGFRDYIRKNPNMKLTYAHSGYGSTAYLAGINFASILKLDLNFIPYTSSDPALRDIAEGYVDMMIDQSTSALPFIQGGLVKGLLITSGKKSILTPDIQTTADFESLEINAWNMVFAPKGTPKPMIDILNTLFVRALENKFVIAEFKRTNTNIIKPSNNTNEKLTEFLKNELGYWKENTIIINKTQER
jgi:tripartite-type tricarboxylate transporter receptor subunit TctC